MTKTPGELTTLTDIALWSALGFGVVTLVFGAVLLRMLHGATSGYRKRLFQALTRVFHGWAAVGVTLSVVGLALVAMGY